MMEGDGFLCGHSTKPFIGSKVYSFLWVRVLGLFIFLVTFPISCGGRSMQVGLSVLWSQGQGMRLFGAGHAFLTFFLRARVLSGS